MKRTITGLVTRVVAVTIVPFSLVSCTDTAVDEEAALAAASSDSSSIVEASFNEDGSVNQPTGYREWVFVGTPLTPNALNDGEAPFPEFHNVYVCGPACKRDPVSGVIGV